jgi:Sugar (and other) transporter
MFETVLMGRFLAGFGHGLAYLTTIVHGSEIVVKEIRGMLFAGLSLCIILGAATATSFNIVFEFDEFTDSFGQILGILTLFYVVLAGLIGAFLTYESPVFLIQRNLDAKAKQVMMRLRNDTVETHEMLQDYQELKTMIAEDNELSMSIFQDGNLRPLLTLLVLRVLSVATFNFPLNFVRTTLLKPALGATVYVVITSVRSIAGMVTLFTADAFPRRYFFHVSGIGSAVSLSLVAILYTVDENMNYTLMALVLLLFDAMAGFGIAQLADIYSAEAFPLTKKVNSLLLTTVAENVLQILLVVSMMDMDAGRGTKMAILYTFTVVIGVAVVFLSFRVPETLKKTMRETRDLFRGDHAGRPIIYEGSDAPKAAYA